MATIALALKVLQSGFCWLSMPIIKCISTHLYVRLLLTRRCESAL